MPVLLAVMLVALIGMTGLAVDYGFAALDKRVLQNAVDAAAVTGANWLARSLDPSLDVQAIATKNNIAVSTTVVCEYIDNSNTVTGSCSPSPSGTTSGVKVTATNDRATFFMRVLGVPLVTVSATSAARVYTVSGATQWNMWGSLFIVCGWNTTTVSPKANGHWDIGSPTDLLTRGYSPATGGSAYPAAWPTSFTPAASAAWEWPLSSSVYTQWFVVHDENCSLDNLEGRALR
jgi:Flp pilus assembly protein TadG